MTDRTTVAQLLGLSQALTSDTATLDTHILLGHCLGKNRAWLIAHHDNVVCDATADQFRALLARRAAGEPVAYLTGHQDFWKRSFQVTRDTLVPRPETERLVELVLDHFDDAPRRLLDLGTGSGILAVSIAAERGNWQVFGLDRSISAVNVARANGSDLTNLHFLCGHWSTAIAPGSIDLIVCNPPYIEATDPHLQALASEPRSALVAGNGGLADLFTVIAQAPGVLTDRGCLLLEHGFEQQSVVVAALEDSGFQASAYSDLNGLPRAAMGSLGQTVPGTAPAR